MTTFYKYGFSHLTHLQWNVLLETSDIDWYTHYTLSVDLCTIPVHFKTFIIIFVNKDDEDTQNIDAAKSARKGYVDE